MKRIRRIRPLHFYLSVSVALIGISMIVMMYLLFAVGKQGTGFFSSEKATPFEGSFSISYAGEEPIEVKTPFRFQGTLTQKSTITRTLRENDFPQYSFMVYAWTSFHKIMLDDEVLYELHADEAVPHMNPSSGWMIVRLPTDYAGKKLTIEITPLVQDHESFQFNIISGSKASLIYYVFLKAVYSLILAFVVLVFGLFVLALSLFVRKTNLFARAILLGLVSICAGVWIFTESGSSQLFFDNRFLISTLCSSSFFLLPVLSIVLLMTYEDFREYQPLKLLFVSFSSLFLAMLFCNTLGIVSWLRLVTLYHALIILTFIAIGFHYYSLRKNHKAISDPVLILGLAIFAFLITIDIFAYLFDKGDGLFFSRIGLVSIYVTMFINITQLVRKSYIEEIYKELAYMDLMTGCKNRSAFEEQKEALKTLHKDEQLILFLSDINNLKTINDIHGHAQGDAVIKQYATLLKETFPEYEVYRIGGDEFCVIARNCALHDFRKLADILDVKINHASAEASRLSVAYSYNQTTGADIEKMFKAVDKEMYVTKNSMKEALS